MILHHFRLLSRILIWALLFNFVSCICDPKEVAKEYRLNILEAKSSGVVRLYNEQGVASAVANIVTDAAHPEVFLTFFDKSGTFGLFYVADQNKPMLQLSTDPRVDILFPNNVKSFPWDKSYIDKINTKVVIITDKNKVFELNLSNRVITASTETPRCTPDPSERCLFEPTEEKAKSMSTDARYGICSLTITVKNGKFVLQDGSTELCLGMASEYRAFAVSLPPGDSDFNDGCNIQLKKRLPRTTTRAKTTAAATTPGTNAPAEAEITPPPMKCKGFGPFDGWIPCAIVYVVLIIVLALGAVMIVIERKGRHRKAAYLRMQKLLKKNEEPSGVTQTQTEGTQGDADPKSAAQKSKQ